MLRTETQLKQTLTNAEADRLLYIPYRILAVTTVEAPTNADEAITILNTAQSRYRRSKKTITLLNPDTFI